MPTENLTAEAITRHVMAGVRTEPLASYLTGLGLIRLIGEQADPDATAAWTLDGLVIETTVPDIASWLVYEYIPTPVLSPWNSGSGFGAKDVEPKKRLERLLADSSPRLADYRDAVGVARGVVARAQAAGWITADGKVGDKARVVQEFRNRCPDKLLPWIDASVVLASDRAHFPPLLGTGGNDGRLDFSTNFHAQLLVVLDSTPRGQERSLGCAGDLLAGEQHERLSDAPVGQFDPAGAGGQASSPYGAAASLTNPWEYVLLVEGALLFASGAARRNQYGAGRAAMPFTVEDSPDGSDSGASGEESRGELWAPVWSRPFTLAEVRQLFGEARASWRGRPARRAVDFYAATHALGVAGGVSEFIRYGIHRRNGLAFVAVPLDRVRVMDKARQVRLIGSIEEWVSWISRTEASQAIGTARRRFESALLGYARNPEALRLRDLLAALTSLEVTAGRSGRVREQIPPRRAPDADGFLAMLDERQCPEMRIAVGIASCATLPGADGFASRSMRQILLPIDPGNAAQRGSPGGRWRDTPLVPGFGSRPLQQVLAEVLAWRSRAAGGETGPGDRAGSAFRGVPTFRQGIKVPAADLHAWARGELDEKALDAWLRACLALDWRKARPVWDMAGLAVPIPALALLHPLAAGLAENKASAAPPLALGPDWAVRLMAGQIEAVHNDAIRRLRQAGWNAVPALSAGTAGLADDVRAGGVLAAALVPRCSGARHYLAKVAVRFRDDEAESSGEPDPVLEDSNTRN